LIVPSPRTRRRARIEIIPLIDVIFFLLATFMMVSLSMIQNRGIPVQLPAAATAEALESGAFATITIAADGALFFDAEPVDLAALGRRLGELRASSAEPRVRIGGDEHALLGRALEVLDLARIHGIERIAVETRTKPSAGAP
jgi:biopolymer transport protein ExbD